MFLKLIPLRVWLFAAVLAVIAGAGWWALKTHDALQAAEAQAVLFKEQLKDARHALELERARSQADQAVIEREQTDAQSRQDALDALLDSIGSADATQDAPVAPVLLDALRGLK